MEQRGLAGHFTDAGHPAVAGSFYGEGKSVFRLDFAKIDSRYRRGRAGPLQIGYGGASPQDGALEQLECGWTISAEGAHSILRNSLGLEFAGKSLDEEFALGDFLPDGDIPGSDFHIYSSDRGLMALFPFGGRHFRLVASNPLSGPEKQTAPSLEELQKIYDERAAIPAHFHDLSVNEMHRGEPRAGDRVPDRAVMVRKHGEPRAARMSN